MVGTGVTRTLSQERWSVYWAEWDRALQATEQYEERPGKLGKLQKVGQAWGLRISDGYQVQVGGREGLIQAYKGAERTGSHRTLGCSV